MNYKELKEIGKVILKKDYRKNLVKRNNTLLQQGTEKGKNLVVLRRENVEVGTFSDYIVFLGYVEKLAEKDKKLIIDRKTIKNYAMPVSKDANAWEYFFEQPFNIGLDDIKPEDHVEIMYTDKEVLFAATAMSANDEDITKFHRAMAKKYMRFNSEIKKYVEEQYSRLIENKRVLGVSIREGYLTAFKANYKGISGHPIQGTPEQMVDLANEYAQKWDCEYIYFTCQSKETENIFKNRFGDKAICLERNRPDKASDVYDASRKRDEKTLINYLEEEKKYVTEMYLLSKCTSYITTENSGAEAAYIMSEGFENFKLLDLGKYKGSSK